MSNGPPPSTAETATSYAGVLPASGGTPLPKPPKYILIAGDGNMGIQFADGTNNNAELTAVVAGQIFPFGPVIASASNTAVILAFN
jgi:hypothetical protein